MVEIFLTQSGRGFQPNFQFFLDDLNTGCHVFVKTWITIYPYRSTNPPDASKTKIALS